jgi:hypothetical protein
MRWEEVDYDINEVLLLTQQKISDPLGRATFENLVFQRRLKAVPVRSLRITSKLFLEPKGSAKKERNKAARN